MDMSEESMTVAAVQTINRREQPCPSERSVNSEKFYLSTPLGDLSIGVDLKRVAITGVDFADIVTDGERCPQSSIGCDLAQQLEQYFNGRGIRFDVPVALAGTGFQQRVWRALMAIPFGETRSYGEIARLIGSPGASRAVGAACGRNPVAIVVPCHRVLGKDGSLTGFAGGVERKQWLLEHEQRAGHSC